VVNCIKSMSATSSSPYLPVCFNRPLSTRLQYGSPGRRVDSRPPTRRDRYERDAKRDRQARDPLIIPVVDRANLFPCAELTALLCDGKGSVCFYLLTARQDGYSRYVMECSVCGTDVSRLQQGHLVDRVANGPDVPDNVMSMCVFCNRIKPVHRTRSEALAWAAYVQQMTPAEYLEELRRALDSWPGASEGQHRAVQRGAYICNVAPYGYEKDPATQNLHPHPWEAGIVRWVYDAYLAGASMGEIVNQLQKRDVPAPRGGRWYHAMIIRILTLPRYAGCATWGGERMTCPALIDVETQEHVRYVRRRRHGHVRGRWPSWASAQINASETRLTTP